MNEHHYQRIDKGVPRIKPSDIEREERKRVRDQKGQYLPVCTAEKRSQVILEAIEGLRDGYPTPAVVAEKHGIKQSTLYSWLIVQPEAALARSTFFSERMSTHLEKIEQAQDPLELGRAREAYRAWADVAAKRDPQVFGIKQEVTHELGQSYQQALQEISARRTVVIEAIPVLEDKSDDK